MTHLALLSDLHGNLPALEAVCHDLAQFTVDHVIVAGDVINWGPFSAQVLERVLDAGWAVIRGNNEFYLLDHATARAPAEWRDPQHFPMLPWLERQIDRRWWPTLATWPDALSLRFRDAPPVRVVHGSPQRNTDSIFPGTPPAELAQWLAGVEETTLIAGHTHLPMTRRVGAANGVHSWHLLNPGTVGCPLDGMFSASYMLLKGDESGWRATFRRVPYDDAPLFREFERQGFVDECGLIGQLVVREFHTARLWLLPFLRWRAAHHPDAAFTPDLLAAFDTANPWDFTPPGYWVNMAR